MTSAPERPSYLLDNTDAALFPHLFETLNEMRDTCPVAWSEAGGGFWALTKYDDVNYAAKTHEVYSVAQGIMIPPTGATMRVIPAELDPPRHTKFRKLTLPYFTEPALQKWIPGIRDITQDAFAKVMPDGTADLVNDIALPVPVLAISLILGLEPDKWRRIRDLASAFLAAVGHDKTQARARAVELESFLEEQIDARRGKEPTDILGRLVNATIDDEPIDPREVLGLVQLLVVAGHETTVNGLATTTYRIISEPGLRERLLADRSLIPAVIDEALRLHPPVWNMARTVVQETEVRGERLCPGEKVMLTYGAANRDPDRFDEPEEFRVPRENNQHLTFGSGRHRCIGEPLAKIELTLGIEALLDNMPDVELAGEPVWGGGTNQHGLHSLPVRFTPRPS